MNHEHIKNLAAFIVALFILTGCGGSSGGVDSETQIPDPSSSPTPTTPPMGGISGNGIAVGPISTFGSIVVNGVTYNTDSAMFTVSGQPGTQADLAVGDIVTVVGTIDSNGTTGTAESVRYDDIVKGPVESIDLITNSLVVLGQNILVSSDTSIDDGFSPVSLEGVTVGQIVSVSGQFNASGDIVATRLEPKPMGTEFEIRGTVSDLDSVNMKFNLNALEVDYSSATLDNFSGGQINNGDFVEAKGNSVGSAGELLATSVELEMFVPDTEDGDRVEIEGFINRFNSSADFDVAGFTISTNGSTVYEGGTAGDLGLNVKVEVEGDIDAAGVIVATKVEIRSSKAVRVSALVDSVDTASGSIAILGIGITTDELTRYEDKSSADVEPLSIGDINVGDYIEVRGDEFPAGSGNILATVLERDDPEDETELRGFVESISDPEFSILGVTIQTTSSTVFRDENDLVITRAEFFNRLAENDLVEAEGLEVSDTTIMADEVEFELD